MLKIIPSNRFRKDLKLVAKRGYNLDLLNDIVERLARREPLPERNRDHALTGDWSAFRECHIAPDWLLIYDVNDSELILHLMRTGTHCDLFG